MKMLTGNRQTENLLRNLDGRGFESIIPLYKMGNKLKKEFIRQYLCYPIFEISFEIALTHIGMNNPIKEEGRK